MLKSHTKIVFTNWYRTKPCTPTHPMSSDICFYSEPGNTALPSFNYDNFLSGDFIGTHSSSNNYIYYGWKEDVEVFYESVLSAVATVMLLAKEKRIIKALKEKFSIQHDLHSSREGLSLLDCPPCPSKQKSVFEWLTCSFNKPNWFQFILRKILATHWSSMSDDWWVLQWGSSNFSILMNLLASLSDALN